MTEQELKNFSRNYFDILNDELKGINLTRINDFEDFHHKQIIDSVLPLEQSRAFLDSLEQTKTVLDVGFGGGFPILPLAYALPSLSFIGLEARKKKVDAVKLLSERLGVVNVCLVHDRLENLLIDRPTTIVLKAVGKVEDFLDRVQVAKGVHCDVFFYKGPNFYELETISDELLKEWEIIEENFMQLPSNEGRLLIGFSSLNVPRRTSKNKNLVKVSQFT